jgi:hypothetical protein
VLFQAQGFRPHLPVQAEFVQEAIDLGLVPPAAGAAGQGAAQVLAAVDVQVAQEVAEALQRCTSPTCARLAASGRTQTMAESTFGRGQNTPGGSRRTTATSARLCTNTARAP